MADSALYEAKEKGRNRVCRFNSEIHPKNAEHRPNSSNLAEEAPMPLEGCPNAYLKKKIEVQFGMNWIANK